MKKVLKGAEPQLLKYRERFPANSWEKFKKSKVRREPLQMQIKQDQGGLCAYCEINLVEQSADGDADFRVEHFHPKSDESTEHNWHLDWNNLIGCCHGGSKRDVVDAATRFTSRDHSCDVPKSSKNLDNIILNPLEIPAFPPLFKCERATGKLSAHSQNCTNLELLQQAQQTIIELRLDAERLNRLRKTVLNKLNEELRALVQKGYSIGQARHRLAEVYLTKNRRQHWHKFFTSMRVYLGNEAEQLLKEIDYNG